MSESTKIISYNGKSIKTKYISSVTDDEWKELKDQWYAKPDYSEVQKQFISISKGGSRNNHITNYYFKDLMAKVCLHHSKWSIEEMWECRELVELFKAKTMDNKKLFPDDSPMISNIQKAIELGGKAYVSKPTNFPLGTVDFILEKYNVNNVWYDFSCGWGARLTGALKHNVDYLGTDPNYLLVPRLNQLAKDYFDTLSPGTDSGLFFEEVHHSVVDIRCQGSEHFVPEWENRVGLAFSSPPYFSLEDYKIGDQSYKEGTTYEDWKSGYLTGTFKNIHRYLIDDGYFLLNINDFDEYPLVADSIAIAEQVGFKYQGKEYLKNNNRCKQGGFMDSGEGILVFTKDNV